MDSLSQLALGAGLGVAVMGRRTALWKAALWGGVAGTLPDLDVLIDHGDDLANMIGHRGESHSLFYLSLFSPLLAGLVWRIHGQQHFYRWWCALWLALITHPLLDACTIYGTRLALPFSNHAFGTGSLFIIDPLYTLPLVLGLVFALWRGGVLGERANLAGLAVSSLYIAWSLAAQAQVARIAHLSLPDGVAADAPLLVTPTAFNTVLWRVVVLDGDHYYEGFRSLLDGTQKLGFTRHDLGRAVAERLPAGSAAGGLERFSGGFVKYVQGSDALGIADLRMGQEPDYYFRFTLARKAEDGSWEWIRPVRDGERGDPAAALRWTWQRLKGLDRYAP